MGWCNQASSLTRLIRAGLVTKGQRRFRCPFSCDPATFVLRTRRSKRRCHATGSIGIPGLRTLAHVRLGFLSALLFGLLAFRRLGRLCAFALSFFKSVVGSAGHATSVFGMGSLWGRSPKRCLGGPPRTDVQDGPYGIQWVHSQGHTRWKPFLEQIVVACCGVMRGRFRAAASAARSTRRASPRRPPWRRCRECGRERCYRPGSAFRKRAASDPDIALAPP